MIDAGSVSNSTIVNPSVPNAIVKLDAKFINAISTKIPELAGPLKYYPVAILRVEALSHRNQVPTLCVAMIALQYCYFFFCEISVSWEVL